VSDELSYLVRQLRLASPFGAVLYGPLAVSTNCSTLFVAISMNREGGGSRRGRRGEAGAADALSLVV
jgi:hypothetical protein